MGIENRLTVQRMYIKIVATIHLESGLITNTNIIIMKNIYLLKDLSKISGYSTHTLKFYLRLGLFKEIGRSPATNFRYFDDSSYTKLMKIRKLQKEKLSLKEIQEKLGNGNHE